MIKRNGTRARAGRWSVKVGDLVRHNGNHSIWLVMEIDDSLDEVLVVRSSYREWIPTKAFEVISESR